MKQSRFYSLRLCLCMFAATALIACGGDNNNDVIASDDDNNDTEIQNPANTNQNPLTRAELRRLEFPHIKGGEKNLIIVHSTQQYGVNYSIEWDCDKLAQRWTCYQMYASNSVVNWSRNNWYNTEWGGDPFQEDPDIPSEYNVTQWHHASDGFDRGHICASQDRMCSRQANEQTFYLSNMQPQYNAFNAGIWANMEQKVRSWNHNNFRDTLYVCKGGTIDKAEQQLMISNKGLIVPKYFFMAVLCKNKYGYKAMAFWIEHTNAARKDDSLSQYVITIDKLEELTGIDFFCNLPDNEEQRVESSVANKAWGL